MPNSLIISSAATQPYILVTGAGLWTPDVLERHFGALDRDLRAMRARAGLARVLVDLSAAAVQTAETAEKLKRWTARIYRDEDQVAVVCATRLLAMQVKHQAKIRNLCTFADRDLAVAWLLADAMPEAARSA